MSQLEPVDIGMLAVPRGRRVLRHLKVKTVGDFLQVDLDRIGSLPKLW